MRPYFWDRQDAGQKLAEELNPYREDNPLVLAIPHGGVPVAIEVAQSLETEMEVMVVRKIPIPFNTEAGFGAITDDGTILLNEPLVKQLRLSSRQIEHQAEKVKREIAQRVALYRGKEPPSSLEQKTVILIDDGLASGFTMLAAVESVKHRNAKKIIVSSPVISSSALHLLKEKIDHLVSLIIAETPYFAVASFYHHWYDLSEEEVISYLERWRKSHPLQRIKR